MPWRQRLLLLVALLALGLEYRSADGAKGHKRASDQVQESGGEGGGGGGGGGGGRGGCPGAGPHTSAGEVNSIGVHHQEHGRLDMAEACYDAAIRSRPDFAMAYFNKGTLHMSSSKPALAIQAFNKVVSLEPSYAQAYYNIGSALVTMGRYREASNNFRLAVDVDPNYVHAHANLAYVLQMQGDLEGSKAHHQASIRIDPGFADGWMNLGNVLKALGHVDASIQSYQTATALRPDHATAHYNLGVVQQSRGNIEAAVEAYGSSIKNDPLFDKAHYNQGICFQMQGKWSQAASCMERSARLKPDSFESYNNLGANLERMGRLPESLIAYEIALKLSDESGGDAALANLYRALQGVCAWDSAGGRDFLVSKVMRALEGILRGVGAGGGGGGIWWDLEMYPISADLALRVARHTSTRHLARVGGSVRHIYSSASTHRPYTHSALRVGYLVDSVNPGGATAMLARVLERHDRARVHTTVYLLSRGNAELHEAHVRELRESCDAFRDLTEVTRHSNQRGAPEAAANIIASDTTHILISVGERSAGIQQAILALKPAPLQALLGGVGSTGSAYVSYILGDPVLIPPDSAVHYTEKLSLQPSPSLIPPLPQASINSSDASINRSTSLSRRDHGLPEGGVLFVALVEAVKITPGIFSVWASVLKRVEGSMLLLPRYNALAEENLRRQAAEHGLEDGQIMFTPPSMRCQAGGVCTRHSSNTDLVLSEGEKRAVAACADVILDGGELGGSPRALAEVLSLAPISGVSLAGERIVSRTGPSLATGSAGCYAARSLAEYEDIAVALAKWAITTKKGAEKEVPLPGGGNAKSRGGRSARGSRGAASVSAGDWVVGFEVALRGMWEIHEAGMRPMNVVVGAVTQ